MTHIFTPAQSAEIDDRIVEMIVAIMGEGQYSRACRAIANERYLDRQAEDDGDDVLPANVQPIATAPQDRFLLAYCPDAPRCDTWPTAPWIIAKWHDDTDAWRDEDGIQVQPTGWLALSDQNLRLLSPEDSGRPEQALPSEGRARLQTVRLECLKLALKHDATNIRRAIDLAAEFERQVQTGFRVSDVTPSAGPA